MSRCRFVKTYDVKSNLLRLNTCHKPLLSETRVPYYEQCFRLDIIVTKIGHFHCHVDSYHQNLKKKRILPYIYNIEPDKSSVGQSGLDEMLNTPASSEEYLSFTSK